MHYAIVEDRKEDQDYLAGLIRAEHAKSGFPAEFSFYESGEAFLLDFISGVFQAVFLDIMLDKNGLNGLETARRLRLLAERTPIIFTTSELDFALEGYEVHPLDYLLNRLQMKLPFISMNRAMSYLHCLDPQMFQNRRLPPICRNTVHFSLLLQLQQPFHPGRSRLFWDP